MNYIYGYARVSTKSQDLNRQLEILDGYQCDMILTEKISGTKSNRPELNKLKEFVRNGDTIIVESWSRLGRSTRDLIELVDFFSNKNVKVISVKENFDTTSPQGKLMLTVFQAFSEFERDLIVQRTKEGLASARARGRVGGRPRLDEKKVKQALKLYEDNYPVSDIIELTGISKATLYRRLHEMENKK